MSETGKYRIPKASRFLIGVATMILSLAPMSVFAGQTAILNGLDKSTSSCGDIRTKTLRALVKGFIERDEVPGTALLIAQQGQVVFREAYGWADVKAKSRLRRNFSSGDR